MPEFSFIALTAAGAEQKGSITADTPADASRELKNRGLLPVSVAAQSVLSRDISISFFEKKPRVRDLSVFCRQFVSILDAGVPVISALEMLSEQTENKLLANALSDIRLKVETGESLTEAMRRHVGIFGEMCVSLISAGEASGSLSTSFYRMAEQYEKDAKIRGMVKKASVYPTIILIVTVVVIGVMLTLVVPTFQDIFEQLGSELPALTLGVVAVSDFMQAYWFYVVLMLAGAVVIIRLFARSTAGRYAFGRLFLKAPVIRQFVVKTASARMARTLSTLIGSGIPLIEALEIVANTMSNIIFRDALMSARDDVSMGSTLSETLRSAKIFPPLVYQMLRIGEESGNIEGMLGKIADYYDEESEAATQALMSMLEPAIIILMAAVVGTIIMSVMLPLADMYGQLENL
ncbi:MAG: type II secretion system F family protein [Oscillospiraceae bacterium]|nr:type II secretion system F family protein [Oscillospiraceae bacterium]